MSSRRGEWQFALLYVKQFALLYVRQFAPRWCELAARTYDYGACSSHREPKALLNSRHELQARPTAL